MLGALMHMLYAKECNDELYILTPMFSVASWQEHWKMLHYHLLYRDWDLLSLQDRRISLLSSAVALSSVMSYSLGFRGPGLGRAGGMTLQRCLAEWERGSGGHCIPMNRRKDRTDWLCFTSLWGQLPRECALEPVQKPQLMQGWMSLMSKPKVLEMGKLLKLWKDAINAKFLAHRLQIRFLFSLFLFIF